MCKGGNPNTLKTENQANMWNDFKSLALSYAYKIILFCFGAFMMKTNQFRFFFRENSNFPCWQFYSGKALFKYIFLHNFFYLLTDFQNFCGTF